MVVHKINGVKGKCLTQIIADVKDDLNVDLEEWYKW